MLTKNQVIQIREHLNKSQNPLFFFDNDQDGLCSFLLLRRYIGRGKGVSIKSFPSLDKDYFRKVLEFNSDYIFILDKPIVSKEFFNEAEKTNTPVVWIDHHAVDKKEIPSFVHYYNPLFNKKKSSEPVTSLCYQVTKKNEDIWIAVVGCIADKYLPKFYKDFERLYPELSLKENNPYKIFYESLIGKISRIIGWGLNDKTTNVVNMIKFLINAKTPYEVLEENKKNQSMHKRFLQIEKKYQKLLKKAIAIRENKKIIFFKYGGDLSISGALSSALNYLFPENIIVISYIKGMKANISMRGKNCKNIFLEAIKGLGDASGGGHEEAVGGQMKLDNLEKFKENLENLIER